MHYWDFIKRCIRHAFVPSWRITDAIVVITSAIIPMIAEYAGYEITLVGPTGMAILAVLGLVLLVRLITAPFFVWRQRTAEEKAELRRILFAVDKRILDQIDNGARSLSIRLEPADLTKIEHALHASWASRNLKILQRGRPMLQCTINNGTLGPIHAVPVQTKVDFEVGEGLRE